MSSHMNSTAFGSYEANQLEKMGKEKTMPGRHIRNSRPIAFPKKNAVPFAHRFL